MDLTHQGVGVNTNHTITFSFANDGNVSTDPPTGWQLTLIFPSGSTFNTYDSDLVLDSGDSVTDNRIYPLSQDGTYTARFTMDNSNLNEELDEGDNTCEITFKVSPFIISTVPP